MFTWFSIRALRKLRGCCQLSCRMAVGVRLDQFYLVLVMEENMSENMNDQLVGDISHFWLCTSQMVLGFLPTVGIRFIGLTLTKGMGP